MTKQTVDIIGEIIATMTPTFVIDAIINNGDGTFTLESKCTWWLAPACTINILGTDYTIKSFVINQSITLTTTSFPAITEFIIPAPGFLHGTLKMANQEVSMQADKETVFPMGYLLEPIRDRKIKDTDSMIDRSSDIRIFWIQTANTAAWLTDDHYLNLIDPMQSMVDLFIRKVESNKLFTDDFTFDCIPLSNISEDGQQLKSLFDCNLSGIENPLRLEIREDLSCDNKCGCN